MASFRSWIGAAVCFIAWLLAHRFSLGWAAPSFLALVLAALYLWFAVLRVPQFGKELDEVRAELMSELLADPPAAPASKAPPCFEESSEAALHASPAEPEAPVPTSVACGDKAAVPVDGAEAEAGAAQNGLPQPHTPEAKAHDTSAGADPPDGAQSEDGLAREGLQVEEDAEDPVKAQELRLEGNEHFKAGRIYEAREAYSEALHLSPQAGEEGDEPSKGRAVLHCNRAACLQRLGRWDDAVKDCSEAVKLDPTYVKAYARRSTAYEELKKWHDSLEDLKKAIELDPSLRSKESRRIAMLEQRAQEQFEKDKDEMLSKLKELGNTVLGKFGMSTDNFKMEQDPDTGSYSIKFQSRFWMSWADFSLIFDAVETCPMVSAVRKASYAPLNPRPRSKQDHPSGAFLRLWRWECCEDHRPPPLTELLRFLEVTQGWTKRCRQNVTAVHCRGGKGRTGSFCCSWLLYTKEAEDAEDALNFFALRRTDLEKKRLSKVQGVETPSQVRYVGYVDRLLREQMAYLPSLVSMPRLEEVLLASVQATKFFTEQFEMLHRGHHLVAVVQDASTGRSIASALGQNDGDAKIWHFGEARLSGDVGLIVYTCHPDGLPVDKEQASALISEGAWQGVAAPGAPAAAGSGKRKLKEAFGCFFHVNFLDGDVLEIPATETDQACKRPELFCPKGVLNLVCKRA
ncbi:Tetratricopeptide repeat protein 1 [Symbiodinium microadriaticum]|uniref:Tetratricopeptide repeat protein 1 n=1 Tax=Symbiodinium microadriaticum TaxID=2951 RepID=A0A1Q9CK06_SYMMI|nr:Tetratricopeptide repeat protein 1 [Symbiodinium microadriaticum]